MHRLFLSLLICFTINFSHAADLEIVSADFDPYTYATPKGGSGVMYEIVQELARRVGQSTHIEFLPWSRAQMRAQLKPNIGIFPLARVPEREDKYTWLVHVLDDPYVLFAKKNSKVDISTLEAARNLRVGTYRGSLAELLLRKMKFNNFKSVLSDNQNLKMLKTDRIDVWVAPLSFKKKFNGKGKDELRVGATVVMLNEYLAASKPLDPETVEKWQVAFESMKKDGSYAKIMKKYGLHPLK